MFCFAEFSFFDPNDPLCREVLLDPRTTIPELFAVLRQWVPQVQRNISVIGNEVRVILNLVVFKDNMKCDDVYLNGTKYTFTL